MAREIADSDDESDFVAPHRRLTALETPKSTSSHDPILDLPFDQFLSPTQEQPFHEANNCTHQEASWTTASVTDLSLSRTEKTVSTPETSEPGQSSAKGNTALKRSQVSPEGIVGERDSRNPPAKKRQKTCGRSPTDSPEDDITVAVNGQQTEQCSVSEQDSSRFPREGSTSYKTQSRVRHTGLQQLSNDTQSAQQQSVQGKGILQTRTVNSSVGGYQSINIDYSGSGAGFDFNPFGTLSQVSLDGEPNAETEKVVSLFRNSSNNRAKTLSLPLSYDDLKCEGFGKAAESDIIEKNKKASSDTSLAMSPETSVQPSFVAKILEMNELAACPQSHECHSESASKDLKNQKQLQSNVTTEVKTQLLPDEDHDIDRDESESEQTVPSKSSRKRRDISLDPVSRTSEMVDGGAERVNSRRKRCGSEVSEQVNELPKKDLSSDLGLDDPEVIGLPVEKYVPRPSRRRRAKEETLVRGCPPKLQEEGQLAVCDDVDNNPATAKPTKSKKGRKRRGKEPGNVAAKAETLPSAIIDEGRSKRVNEAAVTEVQGEDIDSQTLASPTLMHEQGNAKSCTEPMLSSTSCLETNATTASTRRNQKISVNVPRPSGSTTRQHSKSISTATKMEGFENEEAVQPESEQEQEQENMQKQQETESLRYALETKDPNIQSPSNVKIHGQLDSLKVTEDFKQVEQKLDSSTKENSHMSPTNVAAKASNILLSTQHRIGLSRRHFIPSLLRKVDRDKEPPKVVDKKEKLTKKQQELREKEILEREDGEQEGPSIYSAKDRGADGFLVEWDD